MEKENGNLNREALVKAEPGAAKSTAPTATYLGSGSAVLSTAIKAFMKVSELTSMPPHMVMEHAMKVMKEALNDGDSFDAVRDAVTRADVPFVINYAKIQAKDKKDEEHLAAEQLKCVVKLFNVLKEFLDKRGKLQLGTDGAAAVDMTTRLVHSWREQST